MDLMSHTEVDRGIKFADAVETILFGASPRSAPTAAGGPADLSRSAASQPKALISLREANDA